MPNTIYPAYSNGVTLKEVTFSVLPLEANEIRIYKGTGNWDVHHYDHETHLIGEYIKTIWMG